MLNLARQSFANPFLPAIGASFQPGLAGFPGWHPGAGLGQQFGGFAPTPYGVVPTGFGQINPLAVLAAQFAQGATPAIHPVLAQMMTNVPGLTHLPGLGVGRVGPYGIDPRLALGALGQQVGYGEPSISPFGISPTGAGEPTGMPFAQQLSPLANPFVQQPLPIRPLIGAQQGIGAQPLIPGFTAPFTQGVDPYRAIIEAQLISQLLTNPWLQLQRGYGAVPEIPGIGVPFTGQSVNPAFNVPFCG